MDGDRSKHLYRRGQRGSAIPTETSGRKKKTNAKNVRILTWLQICAITAAILSAWFYYNPEYTTATTRGLIDGIIFSEVKSSALIDGQVLTVGEAIYGTKVVEIGRHKVTFEKNGKRWDQRVRQRPNSSWDEPDAPIEANRSSSAPPAGPVPANAAVPADNPSVPTAGPTATPQAPQAEPPPAPQ